MATATGYEHVILDERGVPLIAGTTTKVIEVVLDHQVHGWSPEEIKDQYPYLSLGQIHSALGYYWDHQAELDQDIQRRDDMAEQMRQAAPPSPLAKRLREQGLL